MEKLQKIVDSVTNRQDEIEGKMDKVQKVIDDIEKDIYFDDTDYDLEIICPYCNFNFTLDPNETKDEIECPECKNLIEIDWERRDI